VTAGYSDYIVVGLSHRTAPVSVRERFAVQAEHLPAALLAMRARPGVEDAMLVSTCNRVEWYLVTADPAAGTSSGASFFAGTLPGAVPGLQVRRGPEAIRHLFQVTGGLDSLVVGETQILGQVRAAFAAAQAAGTVGPHLDALVRAALAAGRRIRRETGIGNGAPSVPSAAVARASRVLGTLAGRRVLIVGAGEMGEATVRAFIRAGARDVVVANRTVEAARAAAAAVGGVVGTFSRLDNEVRRADIVITSTAAPRPILDAATVAGATCNRATPLLIIDIAVPRNVDPECRRLPGVCLCDIDTLLDGASQPPDGRKDTVRRAERLVDAEVAAYLRARAARSAAPVIAAACADAEAIADREWARARGRLRALSAGEEEVIRRVLRRVVHKVLHRPIVALAEAAGDGRTGGRRFGERVSAEERAPGRPV
jgi:glutamyl-tRNA reductase